MNYEATKVTELFAVEPDSFNRKLHAVKSAWEYIKISYNLNNFDLEINSRLSKTLGICKFNRSYHEGTVVISKKLIQLAKWEKVLDTLLHETAHAIDYNHRDTSAHDNKWKSICIKIGAKPQRCATSQDLGEVYTKQMVKESKYTLTCPGCDYQSFRSRAVKRTYGCSKCNTPSAKRKRGYFLELVVTQNH